MNLFLIKTCESCDKLCWRWETKPVSIGVHYPWAFCQDCYSDYRKELEKERQTGKERMEMHHKLINDDRGF